MATGEYNHEVDANTLEGHSHDDSHLRRAPAQAAHIHWHLHLEDREADAKVNGHTHPLRPWRLPWRQQSSGLQPGLTWAQGRAFAVYTARQNSWR